MTKKPNAYGSTELEIDANTSVKVAPNLASVYVTGTMIPYAKNHE